MCHNCYIDLFLNVENYKHFKVLIHGKGYENFKLCLYEWVNVDNCESD